MPKLDIDFEWFRDPEGYVRAPGPPRGYDEIEEQEEDEWPGIRGRIVCRSGKWVPYRPFENADMLYRTFSNIQTCDAAFDFVNRYGPLTDSGMESELGEKNSRILMRAFVMRELIAQTSATRSRAAVAKYLGVSGRLLGLDVRLMANQSARGLQLSLIPRNLEDALFLQLGIVLTGGVSLKKCRRCGQLFETGPVANRRTDAKFCSDSCRIVFNSHKRTKER